MHDGFLKIKYTTFFLLVLAIVATIAILVLPFATYETYESFSAEDFDSFEEFNEFLADLSTEEILSGKVKKVKRLSLVTEFEYACDELSFGWSYYVILIALLLLFCEGLFVVIKLGLNISSIYAGNVDHDKYMRLKYSELLEKSKTKGKITKKEFLDSTGIGGFYGLFSSLGIYALLMLANEWVISSKGDPVFVNSAIQHAEGVSPFLVVLILLIGAVVGLDVYTRKLNNEMMPRVVEHYNEQKAQQKAQQKAKKEGDGAQQPEQKNVEAAGASRAERSHGASVMTAAEAIGKELETYREMLKSGLITEEEFDAKKKQLLGL